LGGGPFGGVNGETGLDELFGRPGDILPILSGLKFVVASDDRLRLLGLRVPIERRISAEEEICNNTHGPDIDGFMMASCMVRGQSIIRHLRETRGDTLNTHSLKRSRAPCTKISSSHGSLSKLLLDYETRTHPRGTTDFGEEGDLVRIDNSAEAEITDHNICILAGVFEQQILRLEITVNDSTLMKVCNSAEDDPDESCSIPVTERG